MADLKNSGFVRLDTAQVKIDIAEDHDMQVQRTPRPAGLTTSLGSVFIRSLYEKLQYLLSYDQSNSFASLLK